ncbi:unnamed protein product [Closterium sp. Naga37s-1]|nr:unnamed protein product [Closterium sp. Naga37s-1]CAI5520281.1 unnamed protein product [Closterium sp. Naga37s-1]
MPFVAIRPAPCLRSSAKRSLASCDPSSVASLGSSGPLRAFHSRLLTHRGAADAQREGRLVALASSRAACGTFFQDRQVRAVRARTRMWARPADPNPPRGSVRSAPLRVPLCSAAETRCVRRGDPPYACTRERCVTAPPMPHLPCRTSHAAPLMPHLSCQSPSRASLHAPHGVSPPDVFVGVFQQETGYSIVEPAHMVRGAHGEGRTCLRFHTCCVEPTLSIHVMCNASRSTKPMASHGCHSMPHALICVTTCTPPTHASCLTQEAALQPCERFAFQLSMFPSSHNPFLSTAPLPRPDQEIAEPSIAAAFTRCVQRGARGVIVCPYFLSPGRHWQRVRPGVAQRLMHLWRGSCATFTHSHRSENLAPSLPITLASLPITLASLPITVSSLAPSLPWHHLFPGTISLPRLPWQDIPALAAEAAAQHGNGVPFIVTAPIGVHPLVACFGVSRRSPPPLFPSFPSLLPLTAPPRCSPSLPPLAAPPRCPPSLLPLAAPPRCSPSLPPLTAPPRCSPSLPPLAAPPCWPPSLPPLAAPPCCSPLLLPIAAPPCCSPLLLPLAAPHCCSPLLLPLAAPPCCPPAPWRAHQRVLEQRITHCLQRVASGDASSACDACRDGGGCMEQNLL